MAKPGDGHSDGTPNHPDEGNQLVAGTLLETGAHDTNSPDGSTGLDFNSLPGTEAAHDLHGSDELLGAVTTLSAEHVGHIDHALDQLTHSTNLFDVPVIDFHGGFGDHNS